MTSAGRFPLLLWLESPQTSLLNHWMSSQYHGIFIAFEILPLIFSELLSKAVGSKHSHFDFSSRCSYSFRVAPADFSWEIRIKSWEAHSLRPSRPSKITSMPVHFASRHAYESFLYSFLKDPGLPPIRSPARDLKFFSLTFRFLVRIREHFPSTHWLPYLSAK